MTAQGSPPTEKLVAFFSGPVQLDADGKATVDFDIPQFNGTVRVMAVAWTKDAVGHASAGRDRARSGRRSPPACRASWRRATRPCCGSTSPTPTDRTATTRCRHGDRPAICRPAARLADKLTLDGGKRQTLTVPLIAETAGDAGVTIRLAHADGLAVEQTLSIPVRPAATAGHDPHGGRPRRQRRAACGSTASFSPASLLDGAIVSVGVSQSAAFDVPSLLMTLDRYPYGCAEQTTSRALPLLYVSELAKSAPACRTTPTLHDRIQDAIYRVLNYQSSSGSFGLWGPGSGDLWLDSYVTRLPDPGPRAELRRAARRRCCRRSSNLQNSLAYDVDLSRTAAAKIAYALYVLARNKQGLRRRPALLCRHAARGFLEPDGGARSLPRAWRSTATPSARRRPSRPRCQLARTTPEYDYYRSDYGSQLRDGAAMLALAAESQADAVQSCRN